MPIYEFTCEECRKDFELLVRSSRESAQECPHCGSARMTKRFSTFAGGSAAGAAEGPACTGTPHSCGRCGSH